MAVRKKLLWGRTKPTVGYTVDWSDPINKGLKACWLFNEGAGSKLYDATGNQNTGVMGNLGSATQWDVGRHGKSVAFAGSAGDNTSNITVVSSPTVNIVGNITMACWVYPTISNAYQALFDKNVSARQYAMFLSSGGVSQIYIALGGTNIGDVTVTPNWVLNRWNFIAATADGTNVRVYVNGVLANTTSSSALPTSQSGSLYFGIEFGGGFPIKSGRFDSPRLWARSLSSGEIARLYAEPFAGIQTPRRRMWTVQPVVIAFDVAGNSGDQAAASSYSGSASWNGTNRFLAVDVSMLGPGVTVTAMTYGGANCTFIGAQSTVTSFGRVEQWRICSSDAGAPAAGVNTLSITLSGSLEFTAEWASYTGVHQTSPTEAFNSAQATNAGSATNASVAVTSIADNCWIHAAVVANDTSITAGQTSRNNISGTLGSGANEDNNAPVTPAGATTMTYTGMGITTTWAIAGYAIRPLAASNLGGFFSRVYYDMMKRAF